MGIRNNQSGAATLLREWQAFEKLVTYLGVSRSNLFALVKAAGQEASYQIDSSASQEERILGQLHWSA